MASFNKLSRGGINLFETIINHPNLLGLWILNESDGNTVYDFTDNRNNGTIVGSPTKSKVISGSYGFDFPGVASYVNIGNIAAFDFERTSPFSGLCLVDPSISLDGTIISKRASSGNNRGWQWKINSSRLPVLHLQSTGVNALTVTTNAALTNGIDYMLGFSYSGNSLASGVTFYKNGVVDADTDTLDGLSTTIIDVGLLTIATWNGVNELMNGDLSFIAMFNDDLPDTDFRKFAHAIGML